MVLMLWLYVTGLMVLVGAEMNAVLARMAEEKQGVRLVRPETPKARQTPDAARVNFSLVVPRNRAVAALEEVFA